MLKKTRENQSAEAAATTAAGSNYFMGFCVCLLSIENKKLLEEL